MTCIRVLIFFLISAGSVFGRQDTVQVTDLMKEAYFYNKNKSSYFPLIGGEAYTVKTLHFQLTDDLHEGLLLRLQGQDRDITVFAEGKLMGQAQAGEALFFITDSIFILFKDTVHFTVYNKRKLAVDQLSMQLLSVSAGTAVEPLAKELALISQRNFPQVFNNFIVLGMLLLAITLAVLYNYYPKVTADFFRFGRAISSREIDENLLKSRPFTRINLMYYFFFSALAAYMLIFIFYLAPFDELDGFQNIGSALWFWMKITCIIILWLLVKYLLLKNFTTLFKIKKFLPSHYFNYIRMGLITFIAVTVVAFFSYFGLNISSPGYYKGLFTILLIVVSLRALFILIKLMNSASYKFLHLFSYLCGTELIPLGVILFLGLKQPF
ncbi:MAG: DUF4271 domain-containing protein [Fulvivirga sp.]|nr:DUF4271 domain-containing protein [Fulvivirga sp.]